MLYAGILKMFVPKEGQQFDWKWNVVPENNKTTDKMHRGKLKSQIEKDFMKKHIIEW